MSAGMFSVFQIKIAIPEASEPLLNCTFSYGTISIDDTNLFCRLCSNFPFPEINWSINLTSRVYQTRHRLCSKSLKSIQLLCFRLASC